MKRPKSQRQLLRELVRKHPDWTNKELAQALGQSRDTIRGALSQLNIKLKVTLKPGRPKKERPHVPTQQSPDRGCSRGN